MKTALLLVALFQVTAHAQAAPAAVEGQRVTIEQKVSVPLLLAATAADAYFTHETLLGSRRLVTGCRPRPGFVGTDCFQVINGREDNPFTRLFVTHGTAAQIGYFAGLSALTIAGSYLLEKHHHPRAARWLMRIEIGSEVQSAIYSGLR